MLLLRLSNLNDITNCRSNTSSSTLTFSKKLVWLVVIYRMTSSDGMGGIYLLTRWWMNDREQGGNKTSKLGLNWAYLGKFPLHVSIFRIWRVIVQELPNLIDWLNKEKKNGLVDNDGNESIEMVVSERAYLPGSVDLCRGKDSRPTLQCSLHQRLALASPQTLILLSSSDSNSDSSTRYATPPRSRINIISHLGLGFALHLLNPISLSHFDIPTLSPTSFHIFF